MLRLILAVAEVVTKMVFKVFCFRQFFPPNPSTLKNDLIAVLAIVRAWWTRELWRNGTLKLYDPRPLLHDIFSLQLVSHAAVIWEDVINDAFHSNWNAIRGLL